MKFQLYVWIVEWKFVEILFFFLKIIGWKEDLSLEEARALLDKCIAQLKQRFVLNQVKKLYFFVF